MRPLVDRADCISVVSISCMHIVARVRHTEPFMCRRQGDDKPVVPQQYCFGFHKACGTINKRNCLACLNNRECTYACRFSGKLLVTATGFQAKEADTKCKAAGTFCFSSTSAASGAQEVADLRAPWQKAPEAERGASSGVQATLPGYRDATMLACTPPMLNPHIPANTQAVEQLLHRALKTHHNLSGCAQLVMAT